MTSNLKFIFVDRANFFLKIDSKTRGKNYFFGEKNLILPEIFQTLVDLQLTEIFYGGRERCLRDTNGSSELDIHSKAGTSLGQFYSYDSGGQSATSWILLLFYFCADVEI